MAKGKKWPLRRSQLIVPFGVGALTVTSDGISIITGGLDHWFDREIMDYTNDPIQSDEFRIKEWRLEQVLDVDYFMLPPDYREKWKYNDSNVPNNEITIPVLRFPQWHFCPRCDYLYKVPLVAKERVIYCPECQKNDEKKFPMFQVPFVAICDHGHIQDFPWREWVHKSLNPECNKILKLKSSGKAGLSSQYVECECGKRRSLQGITTGNNYNGIFITNLSRDLAENGDEYLCQGEMPWLGSNVHTSCGHQLKGSLRNASNIYFPDVYSSIYIPRSNLDNKLEELIEILGKPPVSNSINVLKRHEERCEDIKPADLREMHQSLLAVYSDKQIINAIKVLCSIDEGNNSAKMFKDENDLRKSEYEVLIKPRSSSLLSIREGNLNNYDEIIKKYFSKIMLIDRLRETRVLSGFSRIFPNNDVTLEERKKMLRRSDSPPGERWLPASIVYGEGLFLLLNENKLKIWERQINITQRISNLENHYNQIKAERNLANKTISPRFVLLHTLSHILINRLTYECGYSSAALRERLYVSYSEEYPMHGILIYTAAGDSEGTMGGLVRMGKPGRFEPLLQRAIENAKWCSADPVCMEMGASGGQGPDSCNLAACHNCALVPETACEEFNRFLDRGVVIGDKQQGVQGYFD